MSLSRRAFSRAESSDAPACVPIDPVVTILGVLAVMAVVGYHFGLDNHYDLVPLVRRAADPTVLVGDWYIDAASATAVRSGFTVMMGALSNLAGESPAFLTVYLTTVAVFVAGVQFLVAGLGFRREVVAVATVLAVVGDAGSIGVSAALDPALAPQTMAWAGLLWAMGSVLRGRFGVAGACIGLATLMHPQLAVSGGVVIAAWTLAGGAPRPTLREAAWAVLAVAIVGAASLVPAVLGVLAGTAVDGATVVEIVARLRNPWHMAPFVFSRYEWVGLAAALAVGVYTIRDAHFASLRRLVGVVLAACVLGTLALIANVAVLVEMQLFRLTPLIALSVAIIVGDRVVSLLASSATVADRAARWGRRLVAIALVMVAATPPLLGLVLSVSLVPLLVAARLLERPAAGRAALVAVTSVAVVAVAAVLWFAVVRADLRVVAGSCLAALALFVSRSGALQRPVASASRARVAVSLGAAVGLVVVVAIACGVVGRPAFASPFLGPLAAQAEPQDDLDRLAAWASSGIPAGSLVLAPPGQAGWRLWSGHPEVVDFKSFPYGDSAVEWLRRIEDVSGAPFRVSYPGVVEASDALDAAYESRDLGALGAVARGYDALYVVIPAARAAGCDVVHTEGRWALVETADACTGR